MRNAINLSEIGCGKYWILAAFCLFLMASVPVWAGSYTVDPVKVVLTPEKRAAAMKVVNTQNQPVTIQVDTRQWSGVDSESFVDLPPSKDLIAMPPTFTLQPGQRQVVRVGMRKPVFAQQETAYRLIFNEIPPEPDAPGLQLALQLSIPVFVQPDANLAPDIQWQLSLQADGKLLLRADNQGNGHFKFAAWRLQQKGEGGVISTSNALVYLLAGASKDWIIMPEKVVHRGEELELLLEITGQIEGSTLRIQ